MDNLMKNKIGVIMGVANERSIAWGIAKKLYQHGAELIFTYQTENLKKRIIPLANTIGCEEIYQCDVYDDKDHEHSIENVFLKIKKKSPNIDFVVHALAFSDKDELKGRYIETSRDNFLKTLDISTFSFTRTAKASSELMTKKGGNLLTLSYIGANRTTPNYNVMGVAKAALETSVKYLAMDLGPKNIKVNAISAGPMKTLAGAAIAGARHVFRFSKKMAPLNNNPNLDQVGNAALYLLSNMSSGVSGEIHYVDGGFHLIGIPDQRKIEEN